ncbi:MAG: hypothetical protein K5765_06770 [Clostridia bacterium]|nr:hypothetical protein [Clostridia bacterium]
MAENKRVTLHPLLPDGTPDQSVNLYPKTLESGIVSDATGEQVNLQHELVSGENIKTVFGSDLVGSGNVEADNNLNNVSERPVQNKVITEALSDKMSKTVAETVNGRKVFNDGIETTGVEADSVMSELIIVEDVLSLSTLNGGAHVNGKILPTITEEFDIGSPTRKYHNVYISNVISDGTRSLKVNEIAKKSEVTAEIDSRLTGAYVIKGTKTVAEINALDLSTLVIGWVYNVSDSGTINQGGIFVNPGDNIVWLGSDWDKLAGTVDFSNFVEKTSDINKVYGTDSYGNQTTVSYGNEASGNAIVQRKGDGQITVLNSPIADSDATSKKYVDDSVEEVRAVAEGKCKSYILSYQTTIASIKSNVGALAHFYVWNDTSKEWEDKKTELADGDYDNVSLVNGSLNSQDNYIASTAYIVLGTYTGGGTVYYMATLTSSAFKKGDIFLIIETDVPDRWYGGGLPTYLYKLETSKVDLTNYYTKSETDSLLNAKANDNSVVHLADAETITGDKTFQNGLKVGGNSGVNQIGLWNQDTEQYDYIYGGTDGGDFAFPSTNKLGIDNELKLNGELTGNVLGKLPMYEINVQNTKVKEFISNHELSGRPFIFYDGQLSFYTIITVLNNYISYSIYEPVMNILCQDDIQNGTNTKFEDLFHGDQDSFQMTSYMTTTISASSTDVQYPSAKAVYDLVQALKRNSFMSVDTTTYPTLADFLASTGEEGYLYLYPVDTSDLTKGYKQYIWENSSWVYMGDTQLDLTNYPRKDQNETITGEWTFSDNTTFGIDKKIKFSNTQYITGNNSVLTLVSDNAKIFLGESAGGLCPITTGSYTPSLGSSTYKWKDLHLSGTIYASTLEPESGSLTLGKSGQGVISNGNFYPSQTNYRDLGTSTRLWKDLYLGNALKNNNATYGITLPDMTSWTADKEIATTDYFGFKTLTATDFNSLTSTDKHSVLTNGCVVIGDVNVSGGTIKNPVFFPLTREVNGAYYGTILYNNYYGQSAFDTYQIYNGGTVITVNPTKLLNLNSVKTFNSKEVPANPSLSSGDIPQQVIYDADNTLKYTNVSGFKKIKYSDYQALTSEEKQALLDVGCQIIGTLTMNVGGQTIVNPILFPRRNFNNSYSQGVVIGGSTTGAPLIGTYEQVHGGNNLTTKLCMKLGDQNLTIPNLSSLNGLGINYYKNNVYPYTTLSGTELKYEEINNISISVDTTFTLATAPNSTYPEYKANITNTDNANTIIITLTGVSKIKTNDSNITIVEGTDSTFTIPADSSVELNIQNGKAIVFNWEA